MVVVRRLPVIQSAVSRAPEPARRVLVEILLVAIGCAVLWLPALMIVAAWGPVWAFVSFLFACSGGGAIAVLRGNAKPVRIAALGVAITAVLSVSLAAWLGTHQDWGALLGAAGALLALGPLTAWLGTVVTTRVERPI